MDIPRMCAQLKSPDAPWSAAGIEDRRSRTGRRERAERVDVGLDFDAVAQLFVDVDVAVLCADGVTDVGHCSTVGLDIGVDVVRVLLAVVLDLQGAQTMSRFRGIGRYTLSFTRALIRERGEHDGHPPQDAEVGVRDAGGDRVALDVRDGGR